jgi:acetaldehyde dehydrogenase
MRDTVLALVHDPDGLHQAAIRASVMRMVADVGAYVPGYRLKQEVQFIEVQPEDPVHTLAGADPISHQVTVFLEVEGAAHYLPAYAGNLDIMTSAALRVAERMTGHAVQEVPA